VIASALLGLLLLVQIPATAAERFFVGRTAGSGTIRIALAGQHGFRARSVGRLDRSGALVLDQVVEEEGKAARRRTWRLVRSGANRISGTLSDARGPVSGEIAGRVLSLRYTPAEGGSVDQRITFHPNGRTAENRMTIRRFGVPVATVEETIRRID